MQIKIRSFDKKLGKYIPFHPEYLLDEKSYDLEMFSGAEDCDNNEICEGDILRVRRYFIKEDYTLVESGEEYGVVVWLWASYRFGISYRRYDDFDDLMSGHRVKIVGNRRDNKEILKDHRLADWI